MTIKDIKKAVKISVEKYGKDATIKALNKMYHDGIITSAQVVEVLDVLNK